MFAPHDSLKPYGEWVIGAAPAVGVQAVATKAAPVPSGAYHVVTAFWAAQSAGIVANTGVGLQVLFGASVVLVGQLAGIATAGQVSSFIVNGLNILVPPNTSVTIQTTAGVGNVFQVANLTGYTLGA